MKKTYLIIIVIALLGMATIAISPITRRNKSQEQKVSSAQNVQPTKTISTSDTAVPASNSLSSSSENTTTANTQTSNNLKNGNFNGITSANQFGDVNVSIVINDGKISDVIFNIMPDGDRKSAQISIQVAPTLKAQTISAQSAKIDGVSGATYTSESYINSLQSAIDAARI